ncbi:MAG: flagellar biosynthesis protein FlhB [Solirubrobacteraceae bacterium]
MADDRTEKPTGKRRQESRKKGQFAKSIELNGAVVLAAGLGALISVGPTIVQGAAAAMQQTFTLIAKPQNVVSAAGLHGLQSMVMTTLEKTVGPIAAICLFGGLLVNIAQTKGIHVAGAAIKPDFKKLSPITGAKNLLGPRAPVELLKVLVKVALVGGVTAMTLVPMITNLGTGMGTSPEQLGSLLASNAKSIIERALIVYALIGILDFIWQRRRHEKSLKMTKQQVKDESKGSEAPPEVRSAIRRRQMQAARARMMAAIPSADVVVTNPTHYAVALRYDGTLPAPVVVAKGKNLIAAQIRRIATENGIPIIPDPPLARSLHASVDIDRMIPAELFAAVAQVLAYVYKMAGRRRLAA